MQAKKIIQSSRKIELTLITFVTFSYLEDSCLVSHSKGGDSKGTGLPGGGDPLGLTESLSPTDHLGIASHLVLRERHSSTRQEAGEYRPQGPS